VRVLVVEDERSVRESLASALVSDGFVVDVASNGTAGLELASSERYELILLDVMLPGMDGLTICRNLRSQGNQVPIIFLSARGELDFKITGLDAGADDYLAKPFEVSELLARVRANTRRTSTRSTLLKIGPITLDQIARTVCAEERRIDLSPTEFALLEHLMLGSGRTVTRASIMQHVWKHNSYDDKVLDVYVSSLRKKLGPCGSMILTDRGVGYRIQSAGVPG